MYAMWKKGFMSGYRDAVEITDGVKSFATTAQTIICREDDGFTRRVRTGRWKGKQIIREWKDTIKGKVVFWMKLGEFQKWDNKKSGRGIIRYHPNSLTRLHGLTEVYTHKFRGRPGKCITKYSWGKWMHQEFWYKLRGGRRRRAYSVHHTDKSFRFFWPDGKVAGQVECPGGFRIQNSDEGRPFMNRLQSEYNEDNRADMFDLSRDGNAAFAIFDRLGRVLHRGTYHDRQRVGEWILNRRSVYFVRGVSISKKIWDTPPEKLNVKKIIRMRNVQVRAALLARIPPEKMFKSCRGKIIHEIKSSGMRLIELPVAVDDGNGGNKSKMRILRVRDTSTNAFYYLRVPDFVWDGGKKTKLNKCEQARQWTFGVNDPKKKIKFAKET